jgi:hypothetical protein
MNVSLLNLGTQPVEVVRVSLAGWRAADTGEQFAAQTLQPEVWATVVLTLDADCESSSHPANIQVAVQAEGVERIVALDVPPLQRDIIDPWSWACEGSDPFGMIGVDTVQIHAADSAEDHLTTLFTARSFNSRPAYVTGVEVQANGFEATLVDAPVEVPANGVAELEVEWRITSCAETEDFAWLYAELLVAGGPGVGEGARQELWIEDAVLIKLARMAALACAT